MTAQPVALIRKPAPPYPPDAEPSVDRRQAHSPALLPLDAGQQYRFSFDASRCIGCHSCEVACAEQNNLPPGVVWRRVGDVEGGEYPQARRLNLSMACNHCLEPACMHGCPTNAYEKLANGIVAHHPDDCVGCGYCTWNCPYNVPVLDPVRRIATKCDMCLPRLEAGQLPACVLACPTRALDVEVVDVERWRADHAAADGPHLPSSGITVSTTRIVLPADLPTDTVAASDHDVHPAEPHWPLIVLTLLTQLALGLVATALTLATATGGAVGWGSAVAAFAAGTLAITASLFHLGRPAHFWKALRNLRRSWLSREALGFGLFAGTAFLYAAAVVVMPETAATAGIGVVAVVFGGAGVYASARIYLVAARPAWNTQRTVAAFFATGAATGPILALLCAGAAAVPVAAQRGAIAVATAATTAALALFAWHVAALALGHEREARAGLQLVLRRFRALTVLRVVCAVAAIGLGVAALSTTHPTEPMAPFAVTALACAAAGELIGRYLFYVTVVGRDIPGSFFRTHQH